MYSRHYKFPTTYNCIYERQYGLRANHSTNHALISLTEDIRYMRVEYSLIYCRS